MDEQLEGGVANAGRVVRRGDHVLRPSSPHSPTIHGFLRALRATGFSGASLPVGIEEDGRERLVYIEGDVPVPPFPAWAQSDEVLVSVTRLMRAFHDASAAVGPVRGDWNREMADPDGGTLVCHNDVCLENVVFRDGEAIGLLDFDFAAPGTAPLRPGRVRPDVRSRRRRPQRRAPRLGPGRPPGPPPPRRRHVRPRPAGRAELLGHLDRSMHGGGAFVQRRVEAGDPNFIRMLDDMGGMERYERRRRWWEANRAAFVDALA